MDFLFLLEVLNRLPSLPTLQDCL